MFDVCSLLSLVLFVVYCCWLKLFGVCLLLFVVRCALLLSVACCVLFAVACCVVSGACLLLCVVAV